MIRKRKTQSQRRTLLRIVPFLVFQTIKIDAVIAPSASSLFPTDSSINRNPFEDESIQDVSCNVNQLEVANDSQLHSILHELRQTAFFRMFSVDLGEKCPISFDQSKKIKEHDKKTVKNAKKEIFEKSTKKEDDEQCPPCTVDTGDSYKLPDPFASGFDPNALPDLNNFGGSSFGNTNTVKEPIDSMSPFESSSDNGNKDVKNEDEECPPCTIETDNSYNLPDPFATGFDPSSVPDLNSFGSSATVKTPGFQMSSIESNTDDEDEYKCDGGADELDDDASPLCSIGMEDDEPFLQLSSSLTSISESKTWESESQKETFAWDKSSDPIVTSSLENQDCSDGADASALPDTFWMDMCDQISERDTKLVNLVLNPERNTGYNGTHIWNAIYEENCLNINESASSPLCYEERVLYRLLSGLHTSTTLSIATKYYPPSKRKNRTEWEPNPSYFWDKFSVKKDHIDNLYFSYVVLLRALRKANPFLYNYTINTGNVVEDETATILLRRLLETHILQSCTTVFDAFDESLMFKEANVQAHADNLFIGENDIVSLKQNFKEIFHNISSILDCVQCQQCKLHGKMAMLGYGTALKILFLPQNLINEASISRNEIVAFINTIAKMSDATKEIRELTHLYWLENEKKPLQDSPSPANDIKSTDAFSSFSDTKMTDLVYVAVEAIASLGRSKLITDAQELDLVAKAFARDPDLLILAKHFGFDPQKFLHHLPNISGSSQLLTTNKKELLPDAIVVGSGLAGLAATLNILDRNGTVVLIEKEHRIGGNSAKASSGINACCPQNNTYGDALKAFQQDTIKSAGEHVRLDLIDTLVGKSENAIKWLKDRVGVDLSLLAQLGGHRFKRTHRPKNGMAGAEIIYGMQKAVKDYEKKGKVKIFMDTKVTELITEEESGSVIGVKYRNLLDENNIPAEFPALFSPNVILATGGFAADRSSGSYLEQYRPELMKMSATAGDFSTGDGIGLATFLGAGTVDMDKVQIHPTGWVDPLDQNNPSKVLAAELMRGVGGILVNDDGKR